MEQTRRARLTGLMAALLTVAAILWTLFASPSIGVVADGSYASAAEGLALRYAEESIPTGQRVEDFAYEDTAYSTLLFASRTSVGAAVALVRLATHPFGLGFSTRYLAVVYALLMGWGAYLLANGLARRSRDARTAACAGESRRHRLFEQPVCSRRFHGIFASFPRRDGLLPVPGKGMRRSMDAAGAFCGAADAAYHGADDGAAACSGAGGCAVRRA